MTVGALMLRPSAFLPLAMSVCALALIGAGLTGALPVAPPGGDEGAPARIFQLLMVLQLPVAAIFALKWLPRAPRPALVVMFLQAGGIVASIGTVVLLGW